MKYQFFTRSEKVWKAMYEAISAAKTSVYLEMYIFQSDMEEYDFVELLQKKAQEGVRVKLILDSFGSMDLSQRDSANMQKSGIEVLFMSHLFHRTHRKILIIDEKIAFIGGVNFHKTSKFWEDLVVKIQGNLVDSIVRSFAVSYSAVGGHDAHIISSKKPRKFQKVNAWIIEHSPFRKFFTLKKLYTNNLNNAREGILLVTPYFLPRRWLSALLHQAVLRGVKVEVLIPKSTNHFFIDRVNYFYMHRLAELGVVFYLKDTMNHAKAMIIDNTRGMVGSQNLDILSFDFNSEIGVFFNDAETVAQMIAIAHMWKADSVVFDYKDFKPMWIDYILAPIIKFFAIFV